MSPLHDAVRAEIEQVHRFFVDWFNASVSHAALPAFLARLEPTVVYITPDGRRLTYTGLADMLHESHGANPNFRIAVRDVQVHRESADNVLATYTEWQRGARASASENARITTVLLTREQPFRWLHIHETWLPDSVLANGSFDF